MVVRSLFMRHSISRRKTLASTADTLPQILAKYNFDAYHTAGRCIGQTYYRRQMQLEVLIFLGASVLLVAIFLTLLFRTISRVLIPLSIVGLAVVWTVALMKLTGQPLDIISNVIPSILLVVGLSAVIHIMAKYEELLQAGIPSDAALGHALRKVGSANFMTALTTAIGFVLLTAGVEPMEAFGLHDSWRDARLSCLCLDAIGHSAVPSLCNANCAPHLDQQLHATFRHDTRQVVLD